jgi:hypothetical protein
MQKSKRCSFRLSAVLAGRDALGGGQMQWGAGRDAWGAGKAGRDAWGAMQNYQVRLGNEELSGELTFQ